MRRAPTELRRPGEKGHHPKPRPVSALRLRLQRQVEVRNHRARIAMQSGQRRPRHVSLCPEHPPVYVLHVVATRDARASMDSSELLVCIGAGPYGVATAALVIHRGIETIVVGGPMSFWKRHMPEGMCLRSGPDWHFDAAGVHTFEAFLEEEGIAPNEVDPVPISVFLDYATWFQDNKGVIAGGKTSSPNSPTMARHSKRSLATVSELPPKRWWLRRGFVTSNSCLRGPIQFRPKWPRIPLTQWTSKRSPRGT